MENYDIINELCYNNKSKYLAFHLLPFKEQNPKTWKIDVQSLDDIGINLGIIKYYAQWRQYGFYPNDGTVFEKTCLSDITNFLIRLNELQKKGVKPDDPQLKIN